MTFPYPNLQREVKGIRQSAVPYARAQRMRRKLREQAFKSANRQKWFWSICLAFAAGALLVFIVSPPFLSPDYPPPSLASTDATQTLEIPVASTESHSSYRSLPPPQNNHQQDPGLVLHGQSCRTDPNSLQNEKNFHLPPECELSGNGLSIRTRARSKFLADAKGIVLQDGKLEIEVDPQTPRASPFFVKTPALNIEVIGTRFSVTHSPQHGGELQLFRGKLRLASNAGKTFDVTPGQIFRWRADDASWRIYSPFTRSETPTSHSLHKAAKPSPRTKKRYSADRIALRVKVLRNQGKWLQAIKLIKQNLNRLNQYDREILSFELGQLVELQHGKEAACNHWRRFESSFSNGRYKGMVQYERNRLKCR